MQSRLPDPRVARAWLDKQIQFDAVWESKVVERILHNLSLLMERSFASVQELNRYRKEVTAKLAPRPPRLPPGRAAGAGRRAGLSPLGRRLRLRRQLGLLGLAVGRHLLRARPLADQLGVGLEVDAGGGEQVFAVDRLGRHRDQRQAEFQAAQSACVKLSPAT